jgi:hypothetical protein
MQDLIIEPGRAERHYWRDLWRFRELLYFLSQRDILVRYKQTAIGVAWALLRPALTTAAFVAFRLTGGQGRQNCKGGAAGGEGAIPGGWHSGYWEYLE